MIRNALWFLLGACIALLVAIPITERQAQWENRTIACWPTKDDPTPVRHP
jgi:spermidine/putrescine-binding protein